MLNVLNLRKLCQNVIQTFELWLAKLYSSKTRVVNLPPSFPVLARKIYSKLAHSVLGTWITTPDLRPSKLRTGEYTAFNMEFTKTQCTDAKILVSKTLSSQHVSHEYFFFSCYTLSWFSTNIFNIFLTLFKIKNSQGRGSNAPLSCSYGTALGLFYPPLLN